MAGLNGIHGDCDVMIIRNSNHKYAEDLKAGDEVVIIHEKIPYFETVTSVEKKKSTVVVRTMTQYGNGQIHSAEYIFKNDREFLIR